MIVARGLSRTFESREAVRGLDLEVEACEIVGLVGPSGAGKTTVQRMLATLDAPTAGEGAIGGFDLQRDAAAVRRQVGYVSQGGVTNPNASVEEEIVAQAERFGLSSAIARRRATYLRAVFELGDGLVRTLSNGQRRHLDIAIALVHEPRVLLLDEPAGLDPQARANLWAHIRTLRDESLVTVLLTTRHRDEVEGLCDRLVVIDEGRLAAPGRHAA